MNKLVQKSLTPGLMAGLFITLYLVLLYLGGIDFLASFWLSIMIYPILFILMFFYANRIKRDIKAMPETADTSFGYGKAFLTLLVIASVATLVMTVWNIILYSVIDSGLAALMSDRIIEQTIEMMDRFNTPESAKMERLKKMENLEEQFTTTGLILGWLKGNIFLALIAALGAIFIRDKKQL